MLCSTSGRQAAFGANVSSVLRHVAPRIHLRSCERECTQCRNVKCRYGSESKIDGLPASFCDDFQCDSSPQVEQSIRSFAKDIERHSTWTIRIFAEDVVYEERGMWNFKGKETYRSHTWNQDNMSDYSTRVTSMELVGNENAVVQWDFSGKLGAFTCSGTVVSTLTLNVLTGRVTEHRDDVRLTCGPLATLAYVMPKAVWSQQQRAKNAGDKVNQALDSISMDEQDEYTPDPYNTNKFIQNTDTTFNDGVQYAILITIFWGMFQLYSTLDGF